MNPNLKILFIRPGNPNALVIIPPLNIGYLSAALKKENIVTDFIDAQRHHLSPQYVASAIKHYYKPTHVCISCITYEYAFVKQLVPLINYPCDIVIGGVHPTILPEEVLKETNADYVVVGEGEDVIYPIIAGWRKKGIVQGTLAKDIDTMPDWNLIYDDYSDAPWGAINKSRLVAPIITSRGCPYECTFCASPMISCKKVRYRTPSAVVDEIRYLNAIYGIKEFNFQDDNFTLNVHHATAVCEGILQAGLKIYFACENGIRADRVSKDLLSLMKKAGCYRVSVGIESADPTVLALVRKRETIEDIERGIALIKESGIDVRGAFIFGLPGETKESIKRTISWAAKSNLDEANFNILSVVPGSEIWKNTKDAKISDVPFKTVEYLPSDLTEQDITDAQRDAFWKFYFTKPRRIIRSLKMFRLSQIKTMLKRIKDYHIAGIL